MRAKRLPRVPLLAVLLCAALGAGAIVAHAEGASGQAIRGPAPNVPQPRVIPRAKWGADESFRFARSGKQIWPRTFWPIQKIIVHHTGTQNNDPFPAATIRRIYRDDARLQGLGDISYNFLIDERGRIYEGRYSRPYGPGESPTGEDRNGTCFCG